MEAQKSLFVDRQVVNNIRAGKSGRVEISTVASLDVGQSRRKID